MKKKNLLLIVVLIYLVGLAFVTTGCENIDSRGFAGSGTYTSGGQQFSFGVKPVETGYGK